MQIDLKEIIIKKSPNLARKIPNIVINMVSKIVCVKKINFILAKYGHLRGLDFIKGVFDEMQLKRTVYGLDKLSSDRKYIFASNHPLGGLDGLVLVEGIESRFKGSKVLVNDLLMNLSPLTPLFLPVNKYGRQNTEYATLLAEHLETSAPLIYFPSGMCSRLYGGKVIDPEWKKNFVQKAIESGRDIVPTNVLERNSNMFYIIYVIRKFFRIKYDLEMVLLPREMFKKARKGGGVTIVFGEPVTHKELVDSEMTPSQWAEEIRNRSYSLRIDYKKKKNQNK